MPEPEQEGGTADAFQQVTHVDITPEEKQIEPLQEQLAQERDMRREERFIFIVITVILLNFLFFSVMESFGVPMALLVLQLLILVPIARRMGMEEIATILDRVIGRVSSGARNDGA